MRAPNSSFSSRRPPLAPSKPLQEIPSPSNGKNATVHSESGRYPRCSYVRSPSVFRSSLRGQIKEDGVSTRQQSPCAESDVWPPWRWGDLVSSCLRTSRFLSLRHDHWLSHVHPTSELPSRCVADDRRVSRLFRVVLPVKQRAAMQACVCTFAGVSHILAWIIGFYVYLSNVLWVVVPVGLGGWVAAACNRACLARADKARCCWAGQMRDALSPSRSYLRSRAKQPGNWTQYV